MCVRPVIERNVLPPSTEVKSVDDSVDVILVHRIDTYPCVVKTARDDRLLLGNHAKRFAAIVRTVKRAVLRFDDCINDVWVTRSNANADASHQLRQTVS